MWGSLKERYTGLMPAPQLTPLASLVLALLVAALCPLSWRKRQLGSRVLWLGINVWLDLWLCGPPQ